MKTLIGLGLLALASAAQAQGLKKDRIGSVVFTVSESQRLIHLEYPVKVELSLIENRGLPAESRYTLSIHGEVDANLNRADVVQIRAQYPGYRIADQSASVSVQGCEIKLSDQTSVDCQTPPGTGNYFGVFEVLNAKQGDTLKAELSRKRYPQMAISVRYLDPSVRTVETVRVPVDRFHLNLAAQGGGLNFRSVLVAVGEIASTDLAQVHSPQLMKQAIEALLKNTLSDQLERSAQINSLAALLNAQVRLKTPTVGQVLLSEESLEWSEARKDALLDIAAEVVEGD